MGETASPACVGKASQVALHLGPLGAGVTPSSRGSAGVGTQPGVPAPARSISAGGLQAPAGVCAGHTVESSQRWQRPGIFPAPSRTLLRPMKCKTLSHVSRVGLSTTAQLQEHHFALRLFWTKYL